MTSATHEDAATLASATPESTSEEEISLSQLILRGDWDSALQRCESHPEEVRIVEPASGNTVLHSLCATPPCPVQLLEKVVEMFPEAVRIQEKIAHGTPLHILCWTSTRKIRKVQALLECMKPEDLLLRNKFGGTVLHSGCGGLASLEVLQEIVSANPNILPLVTPDHRHSALTALWFSYMQSIVGHMLIARILEGDPSAEDVEALQSFWKRAEFLAQQALLLHSACPEHARDDPTMLVKHTFLGLILLQPPFQTLKLALILHPEWAEARDKFGNTPLHYIVERQPGRYPELIRILLRTYPDAIQVKNSNGETPLMLGIRQKISWENGLEDIVLVSTECAGDVDTKTGLYPFLLAACVGGSPAVNTSFNFLLLKAHLVQDAVQGDA